MPGGHRYRWSSFRPGKGGQQGPWTRILEGTRIRQTKKGQEVQGAFSSGPRANEFMKATLCRYAGYAPRHNHAISEPPGRSPSAVGIASRFLGVFSFRYLSVSNLWHLGHGEPVRPLSPLDSTEGFEHETSLAAGDAMGLRIQKMTSKSRQWSPM